jgi:hypothetical protein
LHDDPPTLPEGLRRALQSALSKSTPWWVGIRIDGRPDGYRLRIRNRRPPHFHSAGLTAHRAADQAECVKEILKEVQQFVGKEVRRAWPSEEPLPQITQPLHQMVVHDLDQHRAELNAWFDAFPAPGARREGNLLIAWYGPEAAPTLSLPPLPVA